MGSRNGICDVAHRENERPLNDLVIIRSALIIVFGVILGLSPSFENLFTEALKPKEYPFSAYLVNVTVLSEDCTFQWSVTLKYSLNKSDPKSRLGLSLG